MVRKGLCTPHSYLIFSQSLQYPPSVFIYPKINTHTCYIKRYSKETTVYLIDNYERMQTLGM